MEGILDIDPLTAAWFEERLPVAGPRSRVELVELTSFDWGDGLRGRLRLVLLDADGATREAVERDVHLLHGEHLGTSTEVVTDALDLWVERLAHVDRLDADLSPWAPLDAEAHEAAYRAWVARRFPADDTAREAALTRARDEVPRLEDHIRRVWGVEPPPLCWLWGLHLRLEQAAPVIRDTVGIHLGGIFDRLLPGGWERRVQPGLDERLHMRFRCDPAEMLTFAMGDSDGGHYGFWFHDAERYAGVVMNYARDSAETWPCGAGTLSGYRSRFHYDPPADDASGFAARCFLDELAWWEDREAEGSHPIAEMPEGALLGGPMCDPPCSLPGTIEARRRTYLDDPDETRRRIREALGSPVQALALGRELHWMDQDAYRDEAGALLIWAYEALGRHALADIIRVHLENRDLPSVDVLTR